MKDWDFLLPYLMFSIREVLHLPQGYPSSVEPSVVLWTLAIRGANSHIGAIPSC